MTFSQTSSKIVAKSLKAGHVTTLTAQGNSMFPDILSDTKISISPTTFSQIHVTDIIAISCPPQLIIHKCLYISKDQVITWGTHNQFTDPPSLPSQIIGKMITDENNRKYQLLYFTLLLELSPKLPHFIVLKGAPWQKYIYGYLLDKTPSDIDILIQPQDYDKTKKALLNEGFALKLPHWLNKKEYKQINNAPFGEITFSKTINNLTFNLDVHIQPLRGTTTHLINLFPPSLNRQLTDIFFDSQVTSFGFNFLSAEVQLLYLCLNLFYQHGLRGIDLYAYLAQISANKDINWQKFWQLVNKLKVAPQVYYCLSRTTYMFNLAVPGLKAARPSSLQRFLMKLFINKYTIFNPLPLGASIWLTRLNTALIYLISLITKLDVHW